MEPPAGDWPTVTWGFPDSSWSAWQICCGASSVCPTKDTSHLTLVTHDQVSKIHPNDRDEKQQYYIRCLLLHQVISPGDERFSERSGVNTLQRFKFLLFPRLPPNLGSHWGAPHAPVAGATMGLGLLRLAWHAAFRSLLVCFSLSQVL
jgi:hypothetical protein